MVEKLVYNCTYVHIRIYGPYKILKQSVGTGILILMSMSSSKSTLKQILMQLKDSLEKNGQIVLHNFQIY